MRRLLLLTAGLLLALSMLPGAAHAAPACADLRVDDVQVGPAPVIAGTKTTVTVTVTNGGICTAPGFVVQWRQDENAKTGPNRSVAALGAGQSTTFELTSDFTYPKAGTYLSRVDVDTGRAVNETNETNNLEIHPVTVVAATRNLVVSDFDVTPSPVVQGRDMTAHITVRNTGNSPTGAFRIDFKPSGVLPVISQQIDGLLPGQQTTVDLDYNYKRAGAVTATATVDSTNHVAETDETDNTATLKYTVQPPLADLVPLFAETTPSPAVAGSKTTTTITINNDGNGPAGSFIVSFKPAPGAPTLTKQVNGLAAGDTTEVTFDYTFAAAGTFAGTVTVDSTRRVAEVSETNNAITTSIQVSAAGVDLVATDVSVRCGDGGGDLLRAFASCGNGTHVTQGEQVVGLVTVQNQGNAPSGRFTTEWNPDTTGIIPTGPQTVSLETGPLQPGESRTIELPYTYPRAGNFRTLGNVDAFNTIKETNEDNNKKVLNLVVDQAPIDLVIDRFDVSPATVLQGQSATATITVRNAGPIATGAFTTQWRTGTGGTQSFRSLGLQPGESVTFTGSAKYSAKGSFTSTATTDVYNTVPEPGGEGNNTATTSVTVEQPKTVLDVSVSSLKVIEDGDDIGKGDWTIVFAAYDPSSECVGNLFGQDVDIPSLNCWADHFEDRFDSGETYTVNVGSLTDITLPGGTPLVLGYYAIDDDPLGVQPRGSAFKVIPRSQYLTNPEITVPATGCSDLDGHCYDVTFKVTVKSTNVPSSMAIANDAAAQAAGTEAQDQVQDAYEGDAGS